MDDYTHRQLDTRLGIPAKYADKMRAEAPDLYAANCNRWFKQDHERRMVRVLRGRVRAFLSDRYQRIEHEDTLAAVLPEFQTHPELQFQSLALTDSRMYLKATLPTLRSEIKVGDIVEAGIEITNGEIGNGAMAVWPFAHRLVCLNGMRFPVGGFRKYHVGSRADTTEDVYEMLTDETLRADDKAFLLKARDVVRAVLTEQTFSKLVGKMKEAAGEKIEGDPVKAVELLAERLSLNEGERGSVLSHLISGGDLSRWGIANAVTRTAHDVESYDRADELEAFGGKIIEGEFKVVEKAA